MITIDQLLESVDLDFEPRFVTKDGNGDVYIFEDAPEINNPSKEWVTTVRGSDFAGYDCLKLSEFDGKDWTECIYEVPRTTTDSKKELVGKIEKLEPLNGLQHNWLDKINELVDAVNELKGGEKI